MINDRSEDTPTSMDDFYYLNTTKQLNIEAWRPRQPNAKKPDQCLVTYLGLEPNASWSVISQYPTFAIEQSKIYLCVLA